MQTNKLLVVALVALAALAFACGGSVSNNESRDGGTDATSSSSSGGSGSGSSSGGACGAQGEPCCNGTACNNGLMCSAAVCVGSSSGSGSGGSSEAGSVTDASLPPVDAALPPLDAALGSLDAAPAGLAGFAFIVNDVVQHPMSCPGADWEFAPYPGTSDGNSGCMPQGGGTCPGIESVVLANTGALDMAYIAGPFWNSPEVPGGYPGGDYGAGVLAPGAYVDITSFYNTGVVAIVGSAETFSASDAAYASDEGSIPWPLGVAGSGGATTMNVAEIEVFPGCQTVERYW
jgi:hypothetical protein